MTGQAPTTKAATKRAEHCLDAHGYGCDRAECGRAPVQPGDVRGIAEFLPPSDPARSIAPKENHVNPQHQAETRER